MSEICLKNPPEIEKLLSKYKEGKVPPIIGRDNGIHEGLLGADLLEIFRKGFSATYNAPLFIFPVSKITDDISDRLQVLKRWKNRSHQKVMAPATSCKYLNLLLENNNSHDSSSEYCSMNHLLLTSTRDDCSLPKNGRVVVCMCYAGMINAYLPVYVADEIVAVLFTECKKPKPGAIWREGLIKYSRIMGGDRSQFREVSHDHSTTDKIDVWRESKDRIREWEKILGLAQDDFMKKLDYVLKQDPEFEMSPEELDRIITGLENVGRHISDLADKTYRLEKESLTGWIRAEMASALSSPDSFWEKIQWCLGNLAQLVGADYMILMSRGSQANSSLYLQCQYGLPEEAIPALKYDWDGSEAIVKNFVNSIGSSEDFHEMDLRQYRDVPILNVLYSLYGKGVSYPVFIASTISLDGNMIFVVLGKKDPELKQRRIFSHVSEKVENKSELAESGDLRWLKRDDRDYLMVIVRELSIITNVFFSMIKIQKTVDEQNDLMESVAHDLRTPIQNIMIAAENLRECRVAPERSSRTITGVVTQLQRLNLLAQKAWMLERIRRDKLIYNDKQGIDTYLVFSECRELMTDMAERNSMEIRIDPDIKNWQPIFVDEEMFRLVVLNLLDNGIKYSFPNTQIRIGGWQDSIGIGTAMTFENEGIRIKDEEKDRIFERYFRSKDAIKTDPAGSGVGLVLVKEFVNHYEGVIDVRSSEVGFDRYLNVFSIFLPGR
jgi:signal transduction histidine kinase